MNHGKVLVLIFAIFIALTLASFPEILAQAAGPQIVPSQPIFTLWRVGGKANFTATRLTTNATYFVWAQNPNVPTPRYVTSISGRGGSASFQIPIYATDPSGTYVVSLSTSSVSNTRLAVAHFGIAGIDLGHYRRTDTVQVAGGGYVPNSTITIILSSAGQTAGNLSLKVDAKGEFNSPYRLSPSIPLGFLTVSMVGASFDDGRSVTTSTSAAVAAAPLTVTQLTQPPSILERTSNVTMSWKITYPDGSAVTTSTQNSTRVSIVGEANGVSTEVVLGLSNPGAGVWTARWVPSFSSTLGVFHFVIYPTDFDDSNGNVGRGIAVASSSFQLTAVHAELAVEGNTTIQRTLAADFVIVPRYHDGSSFANVTQASGAITEADGTLRQLTFNGSLSGLVGEFKTNATTPLGTLRVVATVADIYGNTATGDFTVQIVPAFLTFAVSTPAATQRTQTLNATARVTYPDGTLITANNLPLGFNATISVGNFTWTRIMVFNPITNDWSAGLVLAQNATLGDYSVRMNATDPYLNFGNYVGIAKVVPATFIFELARPSEKANPHTIIYIDTNVLYPNGSALTPDVGGVVAASLTNSSGTFTYPMAFNATDRTWLLYFPVPDPGFKFGLTMTFSFSANDQFGNTGSISQGFRLDVGAGVESLVLATIIGAILPIGLIGWAIATVTARRRKHKP